MFSGDNEAEQKSGCAASKSMWEEVSANQSLRMKDKTSFNKSNTDCRAALGLVSEELFS